VSGRVLAITGGRYDSHRRPLVPSRHQLTSLWRLIQLLGVTVVVHGDAIGTDKQVAQWLRFRTLPTLPPRVIQLLAYPIDPALDGRHRGAGNNRNGRMLRNSSADYLAALPGATGTADCVRKAKEMGLEVWEWRGGRDDGVFVKTAEASASETRPPGAHPRP
jgi:hypothetical protein